MPQSTPPTLMSRIVFGLLGTFLFISISILPNFLLTKFYTGWQVHSIVVALVAVLIGLIWGSSFLTPQEAGPESTDR
jgi:hypothetical protein